MGLGEHCDEIVRLIDETLAELATTGDGCRPGATSPRGAGTGGGTTASTVVGVGAEGVEGAARF